MTYSKQFIYLPYNAFWLTIKREINDQINSCFLYIYHPNSWHYIHVEYRPFLLTNCPAAHSGNNILKNRHTGPLTNWEYLRKTRAVRSTEQLYTLKSCKIQPIRQK